MSSTFRSDNHSSSALREGNDESNQSRPKDLSLANFLPPGMQSTQGATSATFHQRPTVQASSVTGIPEGTLVNIACISSILAQHIKLATDVPLPTRQMSNSFQHAIGKNSSRGRFMYKPNITISQRLASLMLVDYAGPKYNVEITPSLFNQVRHLMGNMFKVFPEMFDELILSEVGLEMLHSSGLSAIPALSKTLSIPPPGSPTIDLDAPPALPQPLTTISGPSFASAAGSQLVTKQSASHILGEIVQFTDWNPTRTIRRGDLITSNKSRFIIHLNVENRSPHGFFSQVKKPVYRTENRLFKYDAGLALQVAAMLGGSKDPLTIFPKPDTETIDSLHHLAITYANSQTHGFLMMLHDENVFNHYWLPHFKTHSDSIESLIQPFDKESNRLGYNSLHAGCAMLHLGMDPMLLRFLRSRTFYNSDGGDKELLRYFDIVRDHSGQKNATYVTRMDERIATCQEQKVSAMLKEGYLYNWTKDDPARIAAFDTLSNAHIKTKLYIGFSYALDVLNAGAESGTFCIKCMTYLIFYFRAMLHMSSKHRDYYDTYIKRPQNVQTALHTYQQYVDDVEKLATVSHIYTLSRVDDFDAVWENEKSKGHKYDWSEDDMFARILIENIYPKIKGAELVRYDGMPAISFANEVYNVYSVRREIISHIYKFMDEIIARRIKSINLTVIQGTHKNPDKPSIHIPELLPLDVPSDKFIFVKIASSLTRYFKQNTEGYLLSIHPYVSQGEHQINVTKSMLTAMQRALIDKLTANDKLGEHVVQVANNAPMLVITGPDTWSYASEDLVNEITTKNAYISATIHALRTLLNAEVLMDTVYSVRCRLTYKNKVYLAPTYNLVVQSTTSLHSEESGYIVGDWASCV